MNPILLPNTHRLLLLLMLFSVAGCCSGQIMTPGLTPSPTTHPAEGGVLESYRVAEPADLQFWICGTKPGARGFPYVLLAIQNASNRDVIVTYAPGSIVVHCGPYIQKGPSQVFDRRRQILDPRALIVFEPPENGWAELSSDGRPELMIPTSLPPGKYSVWATFEVPGANGGVIQSDKRTYEVH